MYPPLYKYACRNSHGAAEQLDMTAVRCCCEIHPLPSVVHFASTKEFCAADSGRGQGGGWGMISTVSAAPESATCADEGSWDSSRGGGGRSTAVALLGAYRML